MVIRELTGDVYFGEPKGITTDATTGERVGFNNMIYSESEIKRIAKVSGVAWRGLPHLKRHTKPGIHRLFSYSPIIHI